MKKEYIFISLAVAAVGYLVWRNNRNIATANNQTPFITHPSYIDTSDECVNNGHCRM